MHKVLKRPFWVNVHANSQRDPLSEYLKWSDRLSAARMSCMVRVPTIYRIKVTPK